METHLKTIHIVDVNAFSEPFGPNKQYKYNNVNCNIVQRTAYCVRIFYFRKLSTRKPANNDADSYFNKVLVYL